VRPSNGSQEYNFIKSGTGGTGGCVLPLEDPSVQMDYDFALADVVSDVSPGGIGTVTTISFSSGSPVPLLRRSCSAGDRHSFVVVNVSESHVLQVSEQRHVLP
jgi:hypothetical protein